MSQKATTEKFTELEQSVDITNAWRENNDSNIRKLMDMTTPELHYTDKGVTLIKDVNNYKFALPKREFLSKFKLTVTFKPSQENQSTLLIRLFWNTGLGKPTLQYDEAANIYAYTIDNLGEFIGDSVGYFRDTPSMSLYYENEEDLECVGDVEIRIEKNDIDEINNEIDKLDIKTKNIAFTDLSRHTKNQAEIKDIKSSFVHDFEDDTFYITDKAGNIILSVNANGINYIGREEEVKKVSEFIKNKR